MGPRTVPGFSFVRYRKRQVLVLLAAFSPMEVASLPAKKGGYITKEYRPNLALSATLECKKREIMVLQWQKTCRSLQKGL